MAEKSPLSLSGRSAWVIAQLVRLRGTSETETCRWVIDRWIDGEARAYLQHNGVDLNDFPPDTGGVLPIDGSSQREEAR